MNKILIIVIGFVLAGCLSTPKIDNWQPITEENAKKLVDHDDDGVIMARDTCDLTTTGRDVDNDGCSPESTKDVLFEHNVDFLQGKTELLGSQVPEFNYFIESLDKSEKWNILIQGYTHNSGDMLYNKVMAKRRMTWVAKQISSQLGEDLNDIKSRLLDGEKVSEESTSASVSEDATDDADNDGVLDSQDKCENSDYRYVVDLHGCTAYENKLTTHTLTVRYPRGSAAIDPIYEPKVKELADYIAKYDVEKVDVFGHTSAPGSAKFNQRLSEKRAKSVVKMLIDEYGVDAKKLTPIGKGESELLETAQTKQANVLNRRVEITLSETLKVEIKRNLGIADADELNRRVVVFAQSSQLEFKDRWHIFIMENKKNNEQAVGSDASEWEYQDIDENSEAAGW
ncbi:OmpA family protein [Algibacillus agarilyticus]|uniref:OmpA family protein n=1 Tax=Algibacillus agarilyticus TaxID=2234133 RepID=UPI000DCF9218|nr:OmpA family protein [Algibacillus agarilyticus]